MNFDEIGKETESERDRKSKEKLEQVPRRE